MENWSQNKKAKTRVPIHELIARRWSGRAYDSERPVTSEELIAVLEAARWAPSCFGDEPWRYLVCNKHADPDAWRRAWECLTEGNQSWAGNAPVLILAVACERFRANDKPNRWAQYDTGAASENLCLQAIVLGLVAHQMGGFSADRAKREFSIPDGFTCMAMIAIGHPGRPELLADNMQARELAERHRQPLEACFFDATWGAPLNPDKG